MNFALTAQRSSEKCTFRVLARDQKRVHVLGDESVQVRGLRSENLVLIAGSIICVKLPLDRQVNDKKILLLMLFAVNTICVSDFLDLNIVL